MSRIKGGIQHSKKRKGILKQAKGYKWGRQSKIKAAKIAIKKAGQYAYRDRRVKKRVNRSLWQVRINAAVRECGLSYSKFIAGLKKQKISLNRKVLSELAVKYPDLFLKLVKKVQ